MKSCSGWRQPKNSIAGPSVRPCALQRSTLAQKAAERRQARARPDHDDRRRRIDGQAKAYLGLLHEGLHACRRPPGAQMVGADTLIDAGAQRAGPSTTATVTEQRVPSAIGDDEIE